MHCLLKLFFIVLACSVQQVFGGKIINGREESLQYMASVQHNGKHHCGGFLIRKNIVLTAAHCDINNLTVVLGTNDIRESSVNEAMRYNVVTKCKHHDYEPVELRNDIMTLKLSKPTTIQPIKLPNKKTIIKDNTTCLVAGWGNTESCGECFKLRAANVSTIGQETCEAEWDDDLPDNIICAGGYGTDKGFCQGDSGGPLVCNKMAVGIVSFTGETCVYPDLPNVYTEIANFVDWINSRKAKCKID